MNTVVVAATVTTPTTEIVQLIPDSNTGVALHSQWRCSTCGPLLPVTSFHVEHLHTGVKLALFWAIVHLRSSILVYISTPQEELVINNSCPVTITTSGFPPFVHCGEYNNQSLFEPHTTHYLTSSLSGHG